MVELEENTNWSPPLEPLNRGIDKDDKIKELSMGSRVIKR